MFKKILIVVVVLIAGFAGFVALQPSDFRVVRTATISAPPEVVFSQVNDFHKWEAWSPWAKLDPECKNTIEGPAAGTGAIFSWSGNDKVGEGRMTITESKPNELIRIKLEFIKPFASTCTTEFTFKPEDKKTAVTWEMSGKNDFIGKFFGLIYDCDKMIGADFEKGLAQMQTVAEAEAKK